MIPHTPIEQESRPAAPRGLGRILVATDFSPRSECALGRATHLPLRPGAEAVVLHVLPAPRSGDAEEKEARVLAGHALHQAAHRVGGRHGRAELRARSLLREGAPVEQLEAVAKELEVELVVVGRPHRPESALESARERVVGGLLDRVSRMVLVAVGCPPRAYRRPLVAVDLSEGAHRGVQRALLLAPGATRLTAVHCFDASYELVLHFSGARASREVAYLRAEELRAREALHAWTAPYREAGLQVDEVVVPGEPAEALLATAADCDSDLIVLRRHARAGLGRVVRPHVAKRVVRDSPCDVLVLEPEPEAAPVGASRQ